MRRMLIALLLIAALVSLPLEPATTVNASVAPGQLQPQPAQFDEMAFQARARQVIRVFACDREAPQNAQDNHVNWRDTQGADDADRNENVMMFLIAKSKQALWGGCVPDSPNGPEDCTTGLTRFCLAKQVNDMLRNMQVNHLLGTDKVPCLSDFEGKEGDYDVGLRSLIWLLYNFPPRPDGVGLERSVYWHVRDQLIIVHGTSPYEDGYDYSYHISACGNTEKRQGTPAEHVEQFEQFQKACDALGISAADCNKMARAAGDQNEGCFSDLLCTLAVIFLPLLAITLPIVGGFLVAAGLVTGNSDLVGTGLTLIGVGVAIGVGGVAVAIGLITVWIPETENHILMIETTRYLSNNLKLRDYRCSDPSLADFVCDPANNDNPEAAALLFDNAQNGHGQWMLTYLQDLLKRDFLEYNSRPYQQYSVPALQNLYDLACAFENPCSGINLQVKIAARAALDHLAAKFAVSNSSLKRLAPFRRLLEKKALSVNLFGHDTDYQTFRFALLFGTRQIPTDIPPNTRHPEALPFCEAPSDTALCLDTIRHASSSMVLPAVSRYRPPPLLAEMIQVSQLPGGREESGCESYLQRYHHDGEEIYYCERSFLITAGGVETGAANTVYGIGRGEDAGVALPTTLMAHGHGVNWQNDFIRFDGDDDNSPNLCVDRDFACGLNLRIPDAYRNPACYEEVSYWRFIDATKCPGVRAEFYIAAVVKPCGSALSCEDVDNFGMFEVVDSRRGTFEAFRQFMLATNDGEAAQLRPDRTNRHTRWSGVPVEFDPEEGILNSNADDDLLAEGDVVWADGSGCEIIQHPRLNRSLVISLKDLNNPYILALDGLIPPEELTASCENLSDFRESHLFDPGTF